MKAVSASSKNETLDPSLPLLLQGAARQYLVIDGFDVRRLDGRNIDLTLSYQYYVIGGLGWADSDGEHQGPFTGGGDTQVGRAGKDILFHLRSDFEGKGFVGHSSADLSRL
jgi:hypothetical protein